MFSIFIRYRILFTPYQRALLPNVGIGCSTAAPEGGRGGTGTCTSTKPTDTTEVRVVDACDGKR